VNAHERRRRGRGPIYLFIVLLALPPGQAFAATNRRINTLSRAAAVETFRNPQISSAAHNRFLFSHSPSDLLGRGGDDFANPDTRGFGRGASEPETLWLTHDGAIEWFDTDLSMPGVGLHLIFTRVYRGSVAGYAGPLGAQWEFNWNRRISQTNATANAIFYELGRKETYTYNAGDFDSPAGRYDTLEFDDTPDPDVFTRTDKYGIVETYEFDEEDGSGEDWYRLASIEDLNGNAITFAYDGDGRLTAVTDTLDRDTTLSYDGNDRITKITDSDSREWLYGYDSGLLTSVRTPVVDLNEDETEDEDEYLSGKTTTYAYDGSNRLTEVFRPEDTTAGTWLWSYDGSGRVASHTKNGDAMTITYNTGSSYTEVVDRGGEKVRYEYDGSLRITKRKVQYWDASIPEWAYYDTTYSYNSDHEVTQVVFPEDNRVVYSYDSSGNVTKVEFKEDGSDASPITWEYTYGSNARLDTLTDPNGNAWDFDWDGDGNLTKKTAPSVTVPSGIATSDYNENSVYDGTILEEWAYNGSGLLTKHTDAYGTETAYVYSTVNSKPAYLASVTRDSAQGGLALVTAYAYDAAGNVTQVTDPKSNVTTYTVNDLNQVLTVVEPGSVTKKYHYDGNDRLTKTEAENDTDVGNGWFVVDREYDQVDNLTKVIEDETASTRLTTSYAYDVNDRLTKTTSPEGNETTREYDQRDLVTKVTRKAASAADDAVTQYAFDANGNRTTVTDPRGKATTYAYDGYDRATKVTQPLGNYVEYAFDENSNVTKTTWKNASNTKLAETTVAFDQANRAYQTDRWAKEADLSTNLGDGTQTRVTWRDERGAVIQHTGDICGCELYAHIYDAIGRQVTSKDPMGATDATRNLVVTEYDANSNVTKRTRKERTQDSNIEADKDIVVEYVYDARDRMVTRKDKIGASSYANTVYHYGKRDQLTKVVDGVSDEVRTEYNEQLWKTKAIQENGVADVVTEFTYDDDGRLVTYRAKNATTGDQDTVYAYDNLGRVVTTTWPDSETHVYTY
jgi:YD repeat-containing protein